MSYKHEGLRVFAVAVVAAVVGSLPAAGQSGFSSAAGEVSARPDAGLGTATLSIPASAFTPVDSSITYSSGDGTRYRTGGGSELRAFQAPVNLPAGAFIEQVKFEVFQNDPVSSMSGGLFYCQGNPPGTNCLLAELQVAGGTPGWTYITLNEPDVAIDNLNNSYFVQIDAG